MEVALQIKQFQFILSVLEKDNKDADLKQENTFGGCYNLLRGFFIFLFVVFFMFLFLLIRHKG